MQVHGQIHDWFLILNQYLPDFYLFDDDLTNQIF